MVDVAVPKTARRSKPIQGLAAVAEAIEMLFADDLEPKPQPPARLDRGEIENKSRLIAEITQLEPPALGQKPEGETASRDDIRPAGFCDRCRAGPRRLRQVGRRGCGCGGAAEAQAHHALPAGLDG